LCISKLIAPSCFGRRGADPLASSLVVGLSGAHYTAMPATLDLCDEMRNLIVDYTVAALTNANAHDIKAHHGAQADQMAIAISWE
jgi:hypothetical protein